VRKEVTGEVTLDDLLRKRGTPGPIVFKPKGSVGAEGSTATAASLSPEQRVAPVRPLRETTRLGLGREVVSVPLLDWPVEIRRRVASAKKDVLPEEPVIGPVIEAPAKDAGQCIILSIFLHCNIVMLMLMMVLGDSLTVPSFSWKHEDPLDSPFVGKCIQAYSRTAKLLQTFSHTAIS
jgi:hypothetical protein